jgi:hypothetical protein
MGRTMVTQFNPTDLTEALQKNKIALAFWKYPHQTVCITLHQNSSKRKKHEKKKNLQVAV